MVDNTQHDYFQKCTFLCEIYNEYNNEIMETILNYFPFDNSFEVINPKKSKRLLRRTQIPTITRNMLQIGNIVNVFSKLMYIKDCTPITRNILFVDEEKAFAIIKPVHYSLLGVIITFITKKGFRISKMRKGKLSKDLGLQLFERFAGNPIMPELVNYIISGEVVGLELVAPNAINRLKECTGATDPKLAEPGTLRALYGTSVVKNVIYHCKTPQEVEKGLELFFGFTNNKPNVPNLATMKNCTCCIIKPHVLVDGNVGPILEHITLDEKFYISAIAMFSVGLSDAREFFEIYNGVLGEYEATCEHLAEEKCIVLEVKCKDPNLDCVSEFRKLCGPRDPELARQLYPDTLRALYGRNCVYNGVHCTDLSDEGEREVEYFFKLITSFEDRPKKYF